MIPATKEFLDYELRVDDKPVMIVEAKAARNPLSERDAAQCVQYASVLGVRWCVITKVLSELRAFQARRQADLEAGPGLGDQLRHQG